MKLAKLEHIFITHPSWENIGGLPGVALTIQDVGVPEITLHGPAGTVSFYFNVAFIEIDRIW
jgi:ribonuclease Z